MVRCMGERWNIWAWMTWQGKIWQLQTSQVNSIESVPYERTHEVSDGVCSRRMSAI
jgi:hypothetical protein